MSRKTIICKECKQEKTQNAHGLCAPCYKRKKYGIVAHDKNTSCSMHLGCYIAERLLSKVFKSVKRMPITNQGYDFLCKRGMKIDVKSACLRYDGKNKTRWNFHIRKNKIADYFLCIAFDNRTNLNPIHLWLIPGNDVNCKTDITISISTTSKWDIYKLDISKTSEYCNRFKI